MSQAGVTRAEMVRFLEECDWQKMPRSHGAPLEWIDPVTGKYLRTLQAYEVARGIRK
jgi:hypothetical protein